MLRAGTGLTALLVLGCALYIGNSVYTFYNLYNPSKCIPKKEECLYPFVKPDENGQWPLMGLRLFVSDSADIHSRSTQEIYRSDELHVSEGFEVVTPLKLSAKVKRNGTLYVHAVLLPESDRLGDWKNAEGRVIQSSKLTAYQVPEAETFNLMSDTKGSKSPRKSTRPISHLQSKLYLTMITDPFIFPLRGVPAEIVPSIEAILQGSTHYYFPLFFIDEMSARIKDRVEIKATDNFLNLTINFRPVSIGKQRLLLTGQNSFYQLKALGFTEKDFDEVKGIFTDTNFYFLLLTVCVSSVHLLLDALSFKNDISFWKSRKSIVGLSTKTLIWRCVSQTIVFLYLKEEKSSLLIILPAGFGVLVEYWKLTKALKIQWTRKWKVIPWPQIGSFSSAEQKTDELDSEAMRYLAIVMVPLCLGGAIYSLHYVPHKSWYSFIINCLANGVYAFGFLFMLPQLFLNYKLKSVAHLPWRAFMYKAFNTFIDDIFAFIITMPTAHRVACFRDDVVFLIYLYQRYLYPVDKTRVNEFGEAFDEQDDVQADATVSESKKDK